MSTAKILEFKMQFSVIKKTFNGFLSFLSRKTCSVAPYSKVSPDDAVPLVTPKDSEQLLKPTGKHSANGVLSQCSIKYHKLAENTNDNKKLKVTLKPPKSLIDDLPDVSDVLANQNIDATVTGEFFHPSVVHEIF